MGTCFRLHREVKHHLVSGAASFCGGFQRVAKVRENGECKGIRQGKQLVRDREVLSEIVNNNGGVKDATDLMELPSRHLLSITEQADISDSPSLLGPRFMDGTFQAVLLRLVLEGGYDLRIDFSADARFEGSFRLCGGATHG
jgi:hypothetical protein